MDFIMAKSTLFFSFVIIWSWVCEMWGGHFKTISFETLNALNACITSMFYTFGNKLTLYVKTLTETAVSKLLKKTPLGQ